MMLKRRLKASGLRGHAGDTQRRYVRFSVSLGPRNLKLPVFSDDELQDLVMLSLVLGAPLSLTEQLAANVRLAEVLLGRKRSRGNPGGRSTDAARLAEVLQDLGIKQPQSPRLSMKLKDFHFFEDVGEVVALAPELR